MGDKFNRRTLTRWAVSMGLVVVLGLVAARVEPTRSALISAYRSIVACMFNEMYYKSGVFYKTFWLGTQVDQNPCDSWIMQEIITEIQPDFVVETGTYLGGSSLFYASILQNVNENAKVLTVDIEDLVLKPTSDRKLFKNGVECIIGDSVSPAVIQKIRNKVLGKKVIVTLDSLHTKAHVLKELRLYSDFVSVGSYLVVQDTNVNGHPVLPRYGPGPMEALQEFLKTDDRFVVDRSREKFFLTFYPSGYLKRVK